MSATVRTITADCSSGDGSELTISNFDQDEQAVLRFTVKRAGDDTTSTVIVGPAELDELIGFQNLERARYRAEWESEDDDEEEDE